MWRQLSEYAENLAEIVAPQELTDESSRSTRAAAAAATEGEQEDKDEQEQYIIELERALLQRKKQNEQLELELAALRCTTSQQQQQLTERQNQITKLEQTLDEVMQQMTGESATPSDHKMAPNAVQVDQEELQMTRLQLSEMESQVATLQQKLHQLNSRNDDITLRYQQLLLDHKATKIQLETGHLSDDKTNTTSADTADQLVPQLTQSVLVLAKTMDSHAMEQRLMENFPETNAKLAQQLLELAQSARETTDSLRTSLNTLKKTVLGFFELHQEEESGDASSREAIEQLKQPQVAFPDLMAFVSSRFGMLSHRINKLDQESTALKQQLRQKQQDATELRQQREHLKQEVESLEQICRDQAQQLEGLATSQQVTAEQHGEILTEKNKFCAKLAEYEQAYAKLAQEHEQLKTEQAANNSSREAQEQQVAFELQAQLSACEADKQVALQDAARFEKELAGLERVLEQFQVELRDQKSKNAALDKQLQRATSQQQQDMKRWVAREDFEQLKKSWTAKEVECDRLREALENSAKRFENTDDLLDKRLAAQLVVSYCEGKNTDEVLHLMARMMNFTEDQKARVGLVRRASAGHHSIDQQRGGLFGSLFGASATESPPAPSEVEGKSLSDMWTAFLLDETKESK